jgi:hypothetical protein
MKRASLVFLLAPAIGMAQGSFPTEFPDGAVRLEPEMLKQRLAGKTFNVKPTSSPAYRIQYQPAYAFLHVYYPGKTFSCSGPWRVEGSVACADYAKDKNQCSEFRLADDVLYTKVIGNGEVVAIKPD